ncbi:MAG: hypothetical protein H0T96_07240 [Thermoleophilaceae bacterium]|nr:hypothetical protein [Thermoleophilaceae bacterium]
MAAFAPMCAVAALSWAELIGDPPVWRIAALVALATGCGLVLNLTARLEPDGRAEARIVRVVTVAVALVVGPLAAGVPPGLLAPAGWEQLAAGLTSGVDGLPTTWPYKGSDFWVRETVLLAIPIMTIPAAAFALLPPADGPGGPEAAAVRRVGALLLLLSLIGFAGSERALSDPLGRGALLLVALVAWLFLPRLHARPAAALGASVAILAAGLASLPLAAALAPGPALVGGFSEKPKAAPPAPAGQRDRGERSRPRPERRRQEQRSADGGARGESPERRERPERRKSPGQGDAEDGPPAGLVMLAAIAALAVGLFVVRRRLRRSGSAGDEADELRRVLERLGWSVPPETTLAELERELGQSAGPAAARYARRLRERRFGTPGSAPPSGLDRRALRSALTAGHGPRVRLRGLLALPPAALDLRR